MMITKMNNHHPTITEPLRVALSDLTKLDPNQSSDQTRTHLSTTPRMSHSSSNRVYVPLTLVFVIVILFNLTTATVILSSPPELSSSSQATSSPQDQPPFGSRNGPAPQSSSSSSQSTGTSTISQSSISPLLNSQQPLTAAESSNIVHKFKFAFHNRPNNARLIEEEEEDDDLQEGSLVRRSRQYDGTLPSYGTGRVHRFLPGSSTSAIYVDSSEELVDDYERGRDRAERGQFRRNLAREKLSNEPNERTEFELPKSGQTTHVGPNKSYYKINNNHTIQNIVIPLPTHRLNDRSLATGVIVISQDNGFPSFSRHSTGNEDLGRHYHYELLAPIAPSPSKEEEDEVDSPPPPPPPPTGNDSEKVVVEDNNSENKENKSSPTEEQNENDDEKENNNKPSSSSITNTESNDNTNNSNSNKSVENVADVTTSEEETVEENDSTEKIIDNNNNDNVNAKREVESSTESKENNDATWVGKVKRKLNNKLNDRNGNGNKPLALTITMEDKHPVVDDTNQLSNDRSKPTDFIASSLKARIHLSRPSVNSFNINLIKTTTDELGNETTSVEDLSTGPESVPEQRTSKGGVIPRMVKSKDGAPALLLLVERETMLSKMRKNGKKQSQKVAELNDSKDADNVVVATPIVVRPRRRQSRPSSSSPSSSSTITLNTSLNKDNFVLLKPQRKNDKLLRLNMTISASEFPVNSTTERPPAAVEPTTTSILNSLVKELNMALNDQIRKLDSLNQTFSGVGQQPPMVTSTADSTSTTLEASSIKESTTTTPTTTTESTTSETKPTAESNNSEEANTAANDSSNEDSVEASVTTTTTTEPEIDDQDSVKRSVMDSSAEDNNNSEEDKSDEVTTESTTTISPDWSTTTEGTTTTMSTTTSGEDVTEDSNTTTEMPTSTVSSEEITSSEEDDSNDVTTVPTTTSAPTTTTTTTTTQAPSTTTTTTTTTTKSSAKRETKAKKQTKPTRQIASISISKKTKKSAKLSSTVAPPPSISTSTSQPKKSSTLKTSITVTNNKKKVTTADKTSANKENNQFKLKMNITLPKVEPLKRVRSPSTSTVASITTTTTLTPTTTSTTPKPNRQTGNSKSLRLAVGILSSSVGNKNENKAQSRANIQWNDNASSSKFLWNPWILTSNVNSKVSTTVKPSTTTTSTSRTSTNMIPVEKMALFERRPPGPPKIPNNFGFANTIRGAQLFDEESDEQLEHDRNRELSKRLSNEPASTRKELKSTTTIASTTSTTTTTTPSSSSTMTIGKSNPSSNKKAIERVRDYDDDDSDNGDGNDDDSDDDDLSDTNVPGIPGVDYPILGHIPDTAFDCSKQQYPGFYSDMDVGCQVYHSCSLASIAQPTESTSDHQLIGAGSTLVTKRSGDIAPGEYPSSSSSSSSSFVMAESSPTIRRIHSSRKSGLHGGKHSFLCPNGTIFSQEYLICDWWYNVKCDESPRFYPLNRDVFNSGHQQLSNNHHGQTVGAASSLMPETVIPGVGEYRTPLYHERITWPESVRALEGQNHKDNGQLFRHSTFELSKLSTK